MKTMKIDPYNHKRRFENWKSNTQGDATISLVNNETIRNYVLDMERGINISKGSARGSRSFSRLNALIQRMEFFARKFKEIYGIDDLRQTTEEQVMGFFHDMKSGNLKTLNGNQYRSTGTYANIFKAFWHWHQKVSKKKGIEVQDTTADLDTKEDKPKWVYLTEAQIKKLCDNAKPEYRALILFLFDSGVRSPTELVNIRVSDLYNDYKELQVREETSKTFGRRIKLMLCSQVIKEYVQEKKLTKEDYLFQISPSPTNQYLKRLAKRIFGDALSQAGENYSNLTMYDFRHNSCCYWLPRYKSESALKYRFGWKKSEKIHYYSEPLGMKDTISEEDLLIDITKTDIEKKLEKSEREKELMKEELNSMRAEMSQVLEFMKIASGKVDIIKNMPSIQNNKVSK